MSKDAWIHEEDAESEAQTTPETGSESVPAAQVEQSSAPKVDKPEVAADPEIPTLVLPKPVIAPAAQVEQSSAPEPTDNFPNDYGQCLNLLAEMSGAANLADDATRAQKVAHFKFKRLQLHKHKLEQGLPTLNLDAHSKGAFVGLHHAARPLTKLTLLARTNRDVKLLLEAFDKAKSANETLLTENASLRAQIATLTKK